MTALKNSDREEVLQGVLKDAFAGRFSDIQKRLSALLRKQLEKEHPEFVKLFANPDFRKYLATTTANGLYFHTGEKIIVAGRPAYGKPSSMPEGRYTNTSDMVVALRDGELIIPSEMSTISFSDAKLIATYRKAWADYGAAYEKLRALLHSYNVRETFANDFPEFAKHLPPLVVKAKLPAVIPKDVRADLRKVGVPQK